MRTLILGAGGIGGYFGGRLAETGADVTFLVRPRRAEILREEGLTIDSPLGDAYLDVKLATREPLDGPYDLVLLSCKAYDLETAMEAVRPAVGPNTSILPLLNGVAQMDTLDAAFGTQAVLGGLAHISVTLAANGGIRHLNRLQRLTLGARNEAQQRRCEAVAEFLSKAPFKTRLSDNVMQDMWEKFAFITAASAVTCLMRANVGAIMEARDGRLLTLKMLNECNAVAAAAGFPISAKARGWAEPFLTEPGSDFKASMLRDVESGAKVEADHLQGDMIRRGEKHGVATDLLRVAFCHLQAYQKTVCA